MVSADHDGGAYDQTSYKMNQKNSYKCYKMLSVGANNSTKKMVKKLQFPIYMAIYKVLVVSIYNHSI